MTLTQNSAGWQVELYNSENKQVTKRHNKEMIDTEAEFQVRCALP